MSFEVGDKVYIYYDPDEITGKVIDIDISNGQKWFYKILWDVPEQLKSWHKESDLVRRE